MSTVDAPYLASWSAYRANPHQPQSPSLPALSLPCVTGKRLSDLRIPLLLNNFSIAPQSIFKLFYELRLEPHCAHSSTASKTFIIYPIGRDIGTRKSYRTTNMTSPRTHIQRARERAQNSGSAPTNHSPPRISHHLADISLTPLLSSDPSSENNYHALTTLTSSALSAHTSASRLGLGAPLRIMIETADKGPVILHSFMDPHAEDGQEGGAEAKADAAGFLDIGRLPDIHTANSEPTIPKPGHPNNVEGDQEGGDEVTNGMGELHLVPSAGTEATDEEKDPSAPMLIGTVVVDNYSHMRQARKAASKLEALARNVQEDWKRQNENPRQAEAHEEG